jgi:hypothetical protein
LIQLRTKSDMVLLQVLEFVRPSNGWGAGRASRKRPQWEGALASPPVHCVGYRHRGDTHGLALNSAPPSPNVCLYGFRCRRSVRCWSIDNMADHGVISCLTLPACLRSGKGEVEKLVVAHARLGNDRSGGGGGPSDGKYYRSSTCDEFI